MGKTIYAIRCYIGARCKNMDLESMEREELESIAAHIEAELLFREMN